jgi:hypothetical protein
MPKPNDDIPQPEPPPVRPPILPPDFSDIPQNPSSELQPPPSRAATPDQFAGVAPAPAEPETLRRENGRLRDKINEVLEKVPGATGRYRRNCADSGFARGGRNSVP